MIDKNNFLLKKDVSRVIKESGGYLREISKEEIGKRIKKISYLKQLEWIKRDRTNDVSRPVPYIPYLLVNNRGTLFYKVTLQAQKTVKGKRVQEHRIRQISLKAKNIKDAIGEIKERKLHKEDNSPTRKEKIGEIERAFGAVIKLRKTMEIFPWADKAKINYFYTPNIKSSIFNHKEFTIDYNPYWVFQTREDSIIKKIRIFLKDL